jgi:hypothetical protein
LEIPKVLNKGIHRGNKKRKDDFFSQANSIPQWKNSLSIDKFQIIPPTIAHQLMNEINLSLYQILMEIF